MLARFRKRERHSIINKTRYTREARLRRDNLGNQVGGMKTEGSHTE